VFGTTDSESFFYYLLSALDDAGVSMDGREEVDQQVATQALRDAVDRLYGWAEERGIDAPIANYILTNGRIFFAQRAGLDLHMATQKLSCRDFDVCAEPNKVCMDAAPALQVPQGDATSGQTRPVNHLLVSSEPIGGEDIWEEVPQGAMVVMGTDFRVSLQAGPPRFRVSPRMPLGRNPDARSVTSA
jgi:predicted glutamine amidotransferase